MTHIFPFIIYLNHPSVDISCIHTYIFTTRKHFNSLNILLIMPAASPRVHSLAKNFSRWSEKVRCRQAKPQTSNSKLGKDKGRRRARACARSTVNFNFETLRHALPRERARGWKKASDSSYVCDWDREKQFASQLETRWKSTTDTTRYWHKLSLWTSRKKIKLKRCGRKSARNFWVLGCFARVAMWEKLRFF